MPQPNNGNMPQPNNGNMPNNGNQVQPQNMNVNNGNMNGNMNRNNNMNNGNMNNGNMNRNNGNMNMNNGNMNRNNGNMNMNNGNMNNGNMNRNNGNMNMNNGNMNMNNMNNGNMNNSNMNRNNGNMNMNNMNMNNGNMGRNGNMNMNNGNMGRNGNMNINNGNMGRNGNMNMNNGSMGRNGNMNMNNGSMGRNGNMNMNNGSMDRNGNMNMSNRSLDRNMNVSGNISSSDIMMPEGRSECDLSSIRQNSNFSSSSDINDSTGFMPFMMDSSNSTLNIEAESEIGGNKKVKLYKGNYIVNCPVPDGVLERGVFGRDTEEFGYLRYSAVTCDPNDFVKNNFTLRQCLWNRETELFIVLTMYNEDEILFARSMSAVMENITYMCNKDNKWGMNGWKKVIVCIVSDGRQKIHPRVLNMLEFMGVYQENVMKEKVNDKEVQAHVFEYTTQVFLDTKLKERGAIDNYLPVQLLFCLKEKNKKKINSHRWFFNAFGRVLQPKVCVLIDVGTRPTSTSIHALWKVFDKNKQVAGACGEIRCDLGPYWKNLLNPLVATQHFEYKMSNILDKPLESMFGYISVLPGAFSAYRYSALQGQPLEAYFKGETLHERPDGSLFKSNMYLAEDRILCFELVAKKGANYILKYVRAAKAETDVPESIPEFISQRRRWLNGSFFASLYSTYNWREVYKTEHSLFRKIIFCIEYLYNLYSLLFSWFSLANFFLIFYFLAESITKTSKPGDLFYSSGEYLFRAMEVIYIYALICIFICSLGNRPQGSRLLYLASIILFAIVMIFIMFLTVYSIVQFFMNNKLEELMEWNGIKIVLSILATYGLYIFSSILHLQPAHMITSFIQYLLLLPSFVNILMVYAFCNTHDVSWGTKGSTKDASSLGTVTAKPGESIHVELPSKEDINSRYEKLLPELKRSRNMETKEPDTAQVIQDGKASFRTYLVIFWLFCNSVLLIIAIPLFGSYECKKYILDAEGKEVPEIIPCPHKLPIDVKSELYDLYVDKHLNRTLVKQYGLNAPIDLYNISYNNFYLNFIFFSVLILSAVRFVGSTLYLVDNIFH